jgi:hypothetical protein
MASKKPTKKLKKGKKMQPKRTLATPAYIKYNVG